MFKKQVSRTDAGQKFVHPIRKGDILKKITINAKCLMHAAALTRHWLPPSQEDTATARLTALRRQTLPVGFLITAQNPNETKQVILKI